MYNIAKVNMLDVADVYDLLSKVIDILDDVQSRMYSVEENEMADLDSKFLHSVIKWTEIKQKYIMTLHELDEDALDYLREG